MTEKIEYIKSLVEKFGVGIIGFVFAGVLYVDFKENMQKTFEHLGTKIEQQSITLEELKTSNMLQIYRIENLEKINAQPQQSQP